MNKKKTQKKFHIKTGDIIKIIAGNNRGKTGEITKIDTKVSRAFIAGITMKKHAKPSAKNPKGGIIDIPASIDISNIALLDPKTNKITKTGRKKDKDGKLKRYSKTTNNFI